MAVDSDTSTPRILKRSATPLQEVNEILSQVKAQQLLTIIGACRNDPSSGRGSQDNLLSADFARGFKIQRRTNSSGKPAVGAALFYACNIGERAYEWTETYRNKKQTLWLSLQGRTKLVLTERVNRPKIVVDSSKSQLSVSPTLADAETEMWQLVKDPSDPNEIEEFLSMFPEGKLAKVANFKLRKLQSESAQKQQQSRFVPKKDLVNPDLKVERDETVGSEKVKVIEWKKDNSQMVLIPAGPDIESFYMDKYEVTNAQHREFVQATGSLSIGVIQNIINLISQ